MPLLNQATATERTQLESETDGHSFIVRLWRDGAGGSSRRDILRGYIMHAMTKEKRSIHSLGDIVIFIVPYLLRMGIPVGRFWRLRAWFRRRRGGSV